MKRQMLNQLKHNIEDYMSNNGISYDDGVWNLIDSIEDGIDSVQYTGIGQSLKYWRKMKSYTQKQLCQDICSQGELSKIENGLNDASCELAYLFAERLGIPVGKLFEDWGESK